MPQCSVYWAGTDKSSKVRTKHYVPIQEGAVLLIHSCSKVEMLVQSEMHSIGEDIYSPALFAGQVQDG